MKQLLSLFLLMLLATNSFAQNYTLMTSTPPKVAKNEVSTENFFIEIATELFKRADLKLRIKTGPWIRNQKKVFSASPSEGLLITPLTRTQDREDAFDWILPITTYKLQFITNDKSIDISNLEGLKTIPVCAYRESPAEFKLQSLGFKKIHARVQEQKCFRGLKKGSEKVMLAHGKIAAEKGYKLVKGNPAQLIYGKSFEEETLYLASTKNAMPSRHQKKLNKALEAMKTDGTFEKIISKY